jgi:hypothetical protein
MLCKFRQRHENRCPLYCEYSLFLFTFFLLLIFEAYRVDYRILKLISYTTNQILFFFSFNFFLIQIFCFQIFISFSVYIDLFLFWNTVLFLIDHGAVGCRLWYNEGHPWPCLSFAQVFPVRTPFASQRNRFAGDFTSQSLFTVLRSWSMWIVSFREFVYLYLFKICEVRPGTLLCSAQAPCLGKSYLFVFVVGHMIIQATSNFFWFCLFFCDF